jgi:ABC-2 type transport system permease protein
MVLGLVRDRGALVMAFLLPPLIYLIFASIFASTTGDELRLRVAIYDAVDSAESRRLVSAIDKEGAFRKPERPPTSEADLRTMVRLDDADVGLLIRRDLASPLAGSNQGAPVLIIGDQAKAMASPIVMGTVLRIIAERMPDVAYRNTLADVETTFVPFSPEQKGRVGAVLDAIKSDALKADTGSKSERKSTTGGLVERVDMTNRGTARAAVVYYAGAVAILFLLYSAMQSGMSLIDERQSGVLDRVLGGAASTLTVLTGKFIFLVLQGVIQACLIFGLAALLYNVEIWSHLGYWSMITVAAASAAAGIGLLLGTLCRTRQQAQTLSNFVVLVLSAVGGSMVPRFFLPPWLQQLGWFSPNTWVVEAYHGLLWRDATAETLLPLVGLMLSAALLTAAASWILLERAARS